MYINSSQYYIQALDIWISSLWIQDLFQKTGKNSELKFFVALIYGQMLHKLCTVISTSSLPNHLVPTQVILLK